MVCRLHKQQGACQHSFGPAQRQKRCLPIHFVRGRRGLGSKRLRSQGFALVTASMWDYICSKCGDERKRSGPEPEDKSNVVCPNCS